MRSVGTLPLARAYSPCPQNQIEALAPEIIQQEKGAPVAYLRYIAYDADSSYAGSGYHALTKGAQGSWEKLELGYEAKEDGFVEVYLANESAEEVWFDDMAVTTTSPMLVQENHYDPWGLNLAGIEMQGSPDHKFQYNGKEKQEELGLGWTDYGARMYDAQLGRWHVVDPMAEQGRRWSPYNYAFDNPVRFIDPDGMWPECPTCPDNGMSLIENHYWSTRDAVVSGVVTLGTAIGSLFSDEVKVQRVDFSYGENGRQGRLVEVGDGEVGKAVVVGLLNTAAGVPGTGPGGLLSKTIGTKKAVADAVGAAVTGTKSIKDQATDIKSTLNGGKNSVTIKTTKGQTRYDLEGKSHGGVETPHKQGYKNNIIDGQVKSISRASKKAEPMNQQDIRNVKRYLKKNNEN